MQALLRYTFVRPLPSIFLLPSPYNHRMANDPMKVTVISDYV